MSVYALIDDLAMQPSHVNEPVAEVSAVPENGLVLDLEQALPLPAPTLSTNGELTSLEYPDDNQGPTAHPSAESLVAQNTAWTQPQIVDFSTDFDIGTLLFEQLEHGESWVDAQVSVKRPEWISQCTEELGFETM